MVDNDILTEPKPSPRDVEDDFIVLAEQKAEQLISELAGITDKTSSSFLFLKTIYTSGVLLGLSFAQNTLGKRISDIQKTESKLLSIFYVIAFCSLLALVIKII